MLPLALWLSLTGCAGTTTTGLIEQPKYRVGVLPFPGMFSALAMPNPDQLGEHRYEGADTPFSPEQGRGLLYTCDAGFLDLAHIRKSADWSRYFALEIKDALARRADSVILNAEEPSRYHLTFHYPQFWDGLEPAARDALIDELSIRLGQHTSELASTWHEIITFFGYDSTIFISEKRSAFTYDDMMSHLVGVNVAGLAMRDKTRDYDAGVTYALRQELARLRVVSASQANEALHRVKGEWWDDFSAIKRDLQISLYNEPSVPWLVRDLPFCPDASPAPLKLEDFKDVQGHDFTGFADLAIEPNIPQADQIRALFSPQPQYIRPKQDFPTIMAAIRSALIKDYGENADRPYP